MNKNTRYIKLKNTF